MLVLESAVMENLMIQLTEEQIALVDGGATSGPVITVPLPAPPPFTPIGPSVPIGGGGTTIGGGIPPGGGGGVIIKIPF